MYDDGQKAHDDVEGVADDHDRDAHDDERAAEAGRHVVEALSDGEGGHADGEQADVAHDVAEGRDGVQESGERIGEPRFKALREGLIGGHAAEEHDEQEARAYDCGDDGDVDRHAYDEVQDHEIERAHGQEPAQVGHPRERAAGDPAPYVHYAGERQLYHADGEAEPHDVVLRLRRGDVEVLGVVGEPGDDERFEERHVHGGFQPEPRPRQRAPYDGGRRQQVHEQRDVHYLFRARVEHNRADEEERAVARVAYYHGEEEREERQKPE